jgi:hypothetical protein
MTALNVADPAQRDAVLDLVRWFDHESTSLHHALIMAAERNEADALDPEVQQLPAVVQVLTESGQRWRAIAARTLELMDKLADVDELDDLNAR